MGTPHESPAVSQERRQRRVAVKFVDGFELEYEDGAEKYFSDKEGKRWKELVDRFPGITLKRVYTTVPLERIEAMVDEARKRNPEYQPPDFSTFFVIDVSSRNVAEELAAVLAEWEIVEYAYVESLPVPPPFISYLDAPTINQGVLPNTDIGGINAVYAWGKSGGTGKGVNFIDIEKGWCLDHPDLLVNGLPKIAGPLAGSVNYGYDGSTYSETQHGTSVLGILAANDKGLPWKGIAYEATGSVLSPWCDAVPFPGQPATWNIADAIMAVNDLFYSGLLSSGDVLLLELQVTLLPYFNGFWPVECEANNFYPIELATKNEIVVIEAAGNGGSDFDNPSPFNTNPHNNPNYNKDSGAIIVGAANPQSDPLQGTIGGGRWGSSNFGTRVNCFAWGDSVDSLDADPATGKGIDALGNPLTTIIFGGTSAASAIIAGAAIVLQGICQQPTAQGGLGHRLIPADMRARLSDFSTGTLSVNSTAANLNADRIGVMPNLELVMNKLGIP